MAADWTVLCSYLVQYTTEFVNILRSVQ